MHGAALMMLAATAGGCAHAQRSTAPRLVLETAPRAAARVGAARLELWIANRGAEPAPVVLDADALQVDVVDASGHAVPCRLPAAAGSAVARVLAPGERAGLQLDLSRRCTLDEPGAYRVEVGLPANGPKSTVELRLTRWVNPGPLSPGERLPLQRGSATTRARGLFAMISHGQRAPGLGEPPQGGEAHHLVERRHGRAGLEPCQPQRRVAGDHPQAEVTARLGHGGVERRDPHGGRRLRAPLPEPTLGEGAQRSAGERQVNRVPKGRRGDREAHRQVARIPLGGPQEDDERLGQGITARRTG